MKNKRWDWLKDFYSDEQPETPLWIRIVLGLVLLGIIGRIAWIVWMG